jgi:hypothetical protein
MASGVRGLGRTQVRPSNSRRTLLPSSFFLLPWGALPSSSCLLPWGASSFCLLPSALGLLPPPWSVTPARRAAILNRAQRCTSYLPLRGREQRVGVVRLAFAGSPLTPAPLPSGEGRFEMRFSCGEAHGMRMETPAHPSEIASGRFLVGNFLTRAPVFTPVSRQSSLVTGVWGSHAPQTHCGRHGCGLRFGQSSDNRGLGLTVTSHALRARGERSRGGKRDLFLNLLMSRLKSFWPKPQNK